MTPPALGRPGSPRYRTTAGLPSPASTPCSMSATSGAGCFATRTIARVRSSSASRRSPNVLIMPCTSADRSRLPVPIACDTPTPSRDSRQQTSWVPVPEAPTMPIGPRATRLAKPRPTPSMIAVPQSGPMTSSPASRPRALSAISSDRATLSLNRKMLRPASIARWATKAAYAPGTAMDTRFVPGCSRTASATLAGRPAARGCPGSGRAPASNDTSCRSAASKPGSSQRSAITRSIGPAAARSARGNPAEASRPILAAVPIITSADTTPSTRLNSRPIRIRRAES